jgi:hypothetical protein
MTKIQRAMRLLLIIALLLLAAFGIGITGNFLANNRERYMDNEIKTEKTSKEDEDEVEDKLKE